MTGYLTCQRSPASRQNTFPPKSTFSSLRQPHCYCSLVDSSVTAEALSLAMETFTNGLHPAFFNHFSTYVQYFSNVLYAFSSLGLKSHLCVCPNPSPLPGPGPHACPPPSASRTAAPPRPPALCQLPPSFHSITSCQAELSGIGLYRTGICAGRCLL